MATQIYKYAIYLRQVPIFKVWRISPYSTALYSNCCLSSTPVRKEALSVFVAERSEPSTHGIVRGSQGLKRQARPKPMLFGSVWIGAVGEFSVQNPLFLVGARVAPDAHCAGVEPRRRVDVVNVHEPWPKHGNAPTNFSFTAAFSRVSVAFRRAHGVQSVRVVKQRGIARGAQF